VPAQAVANGPEAELGAQAIIPERMLVVTRRPDQVESNAIAAAMRGALESRHEEAVKGLTNHSSLGRE
jgi:hypothetical protein